MTVLYAQAPDYVRQVLDQFEVTKADGKGGWWARCDGHGDGIDEHPALHISVNPTTGAILMKCFAGCDNETTLRRKGLSLADLFPPKPGPNGPLPRLNGHVNGHASPNGRAPLVPIVKPREAAARKRSGRPGPDERIAAVFPYTDPSGKVIAEHVRIEGPQPSDGSKPEKRYVWRKPGDDTWSGLGGLRMAELPLFGHELVAAADPATPVWFVEGEPAALACREHGLLAVTASGGSSQTDFGSALEVLRGRTVRVWPDNDDAGRNLAGRLLKDLKPLAREVAVLRLPPDALPEKGDAVEWFASGGAIADLERCVPDRDAFGELLAHDSVKVETYSGIGPVTAIFRDMEWSARSLATEMELAIGGQTFTQRIDILSPNALDVLRRALEGDFGKQAGFHGVLNRLSETARRTFVEQTRALRLQDVPLPGERKYLLRPMVPAGVPTLLYGDGTVSKSTTACSIGIAYGFGLPLLGMRCMQGTALIYDGETEASDWRGQCERLMAPLRSQGLISREATYPPFLYVPSRGIPLPDAVPMLRRIIERDRVSLLIVDSAAPACGGKPEDAETVSRYFRALRKLGDGLTTITIAHIPKNGDPERPFGSIFWTNLVRCSVLLTKTAEGGDGVEEEHGGTYWADVTAQFMKVNGPKPKPFSYRVTFEDPLGPITLTRSDKVVIPVPAKGRPLKDRLIDALQDGPKDVTVLARETQSKVAVCAATLHREKQLFQQVGEKSGGRAPSTWALKTP